MLGSPVRIRFPLLVHFAAMSRTEAWGVLVRSLLRFLQIVHIMGLKTHVGVGFGFGGYGCGYKVRYPHQTHTHVVGFGGFEPHP